VHNVFRASEFSAGRKPHAKRGNAHELPADLHDPPLTITGEVEAKAARTKAEVGQYPDLIVTSPLRRTVMTALLTFEKAVAEGVPVLAHEDARECYKGRDPSIYDAHRDRDELAEAFPQVSFAHVPRGRGPGLRGDPTWWSAAAQPREENEAAHVERAARLMSWIMDRPEQDVALATHSLFLLALFHGVFAESGRPAGQVHLFRTGELRSVLVVERPDEMPAWLRKSGPLKRPRDSAWLSVALALAILAVVTVQVR
jgi:broad specificity phosphatase PhoE